MRIEEDSAKEKRRNGIGQIEQKTAFACEKRVGRPGTCTQSHGKQPGRGFMQGGKEKARNEQHQGKEKIRRHGMLGAGTGKNDCLP